MGGLKHISILKNLHDDYQVNTYFVIPVNIENESQFLEVLKKFNIFRDDKWFTVQSNYVKLQELDFFDPTEKFVINVQLNLSEIFNQNFFEVVDIDNSPHYVQYKETKFDENGEYSYFRHLKEGTDYYLFILKNNTLNMILRDVMQFYNIPEKLSDGFIIWSYDEETDYFYFFTDDNDIQELINERPDDKIILLFQKGLYDTIASKYKDGNVILLLSSEQLTKILSNDSDIYLFFENQYVKMYDDFSLPTSKYLKSEEDVITTNVNKFYYLLTDETQWNEMKQEQKKFSEKQRLMEKLQTNQFLILGQNYPLYFVKGTQPNYYYENYFQGIFLREKQFYQIGEMYRNKNRKIDIGNWFHNTLKHNPDIKGIIPTTFSLFFQNTSKDIDFTYRYKQREQVLENEDQDFQLVFDRLIGELAISELIELIKDPNSNTQEELYYKLILSIIGYNHKIYEYDEYSILKKQLEDETGNSYDDYTLEELREEQEVILKRYETYKISLKNQFNSIHFQFFMNVIDFNDVQSVEYQITQYLSSIGFDVEEENKNLYGILLLNDYKNKYLQNVPVGLIQYSNRQIFMFIPEKETGLYQVDLQFDRMKNYRRVYSSFLYYFYIDDEMVDEYITVMKEKGIYMPRDVQEDNLYKEFQEFFSFKPTYGSIDYKKGEIILTDESIFQQIDYVKIKDVNYDDIILQKDLLNTYLRDNQIVIDLSGLLETVEFFNHSLEIYLLNGDYLYDNGSNALYMKNDPNSLIQIPFIIKLMVTNKLNVYKETDVKIFMQYLNLFDFGRLFSNQSNRLMINFENLKTSYLDYIKGNIPLRVIQAKEIQEYIPILSPYISEEGFIKEHKLINYYVPVQILVKCQDLVYKQLSTPQLNKIQTIMDTLFNISKISTINSEAIFNLSKTIKLNIAQLLNKENWELLSDRISSYNSLSIIRQENNSDTENDVITTLVKKDQGMKYNYSDILISDYSEPSIEQLKYGLKDFYNQEMVTVAIKNYKDTEVSNVQVKIDLKTWQMKNGYENYFNSNYNNIIFMNYDETKFIDHWCEKVDNINDGIVWVKIDSIPQNEQIKIKMYILEKTYQNNGDITKVFDFQVDNFNDVASDLVGRYNIIEDGDKLTIPYSFRSSKDYPTTLSIGYNKSISLDDTENYVVEFLAKGINYNGSYGTHQTTNVILDPQIPLSINDSGGGSLNTYQTVFNFGQYHGSKKWYSQVSIEENLQGNKQNTFPYNKYQSDSGYVLFKHYINNIDGTISIEQESKGGKFIDGSDFNVSRLTFTSLGLNCEEDKIVKIPENKIGLIDQGYRHTVAVRSDGTVLQTGDNSKGQLNIQDWTNIIQVSQGHFHTVGLKSDGTVIQVGDNYYGQCNVQDWTDIVQISQGLYHTVGLKSDGTVIQTGDNSKGQLNIQDLTDVVQIQQGSYHTVGLKSDGTVVQVGDNSYGQCNVQSWTDIVQIQQGDDYTVGLKSDGTVVQVGDNYYGQCNVQDWTDIIQIQQGYHHTLGLKNNGTVVQVGNNNKGQCEVDFWRDIIAIQQGYENTVAVTNQGLVVQVGDNTFEQCNVTDWFLFIYEPKTGNIKVNNITWQIAEHYYGTLILDWVRVRKNLDNVVVVELSKDVEDITVTQSPEVITVEPILVNEPYRNIISQGHLFVVGIKPDGTIAQTGNDFNGQISGTQTWTDIIQIQQGDQHVLGIKNDGTVLLQENGDYTVLDWGDIVQVDSGFWYYAGLRKDGRVVQGGIDDYGAYDNVTGLYDIIQIQQGSNHLVGLRSDGTVVQIGKNDKGQCDVTDWTNIIQVQQGSSHTVGLRSDGTVVQIGSNSYGQCNVSDWTDIVSIQQGEYHTVGLKSDGTVVQVGNTGDGRCDVSGWTNIIDIAQGSRNTFGVRSDGTVVQVGYSGYNLLTDVTTWVLKTPPLSMGNTSIFSTTANSNIDTQIRYFMINYTNDSLIDKEVKLRFFIPQDPATGENLFNINEDFSNILIYDKDFKIYPIEKGDLYNSYIIDLGVIKSGETKKLTIEIKE